jgi:hypothetical protein
MMEFGSIIDLVDKFSLILVIHVSFNFGNPCLV